MTKTFAVTIANSIVKNSSNIVGFVQSGTQDGDDIDLWCISYEKIDKVEKQEIEDKLSKSEQQLDLYFHTLKQWKSCNMGDRQGSKAEVLLDLGFDPHKQQFHFDDTSMLGAYNYASVRKFSKTKEKLSVEKLAKKIDVSYEGVIDWMNFYTLAFLKYYIANPNTKTKNYISRKYIERLSKFLIRVAFGYFAAKQILQNKRAFIKQLFKLHGNPDIRLYKIIKNSKNKFFDIEQLELLDIAVKIRTQDIIPKDIETFMTRSINLIFCLSSFIGSEKRGNRRIDKFVSLALMDWANEGQRRTYKNGEVLIDEKDNKNSDIFFLPPIKEDGTRNGDLNISANRKRITVAKPGRLVGEIKALAKIAKRTASVKAKGSVEVNIIPYKNVEKILNKQKELVQFERFKIPKTRDTRRLDILLRYLVFASYDFLKTFVYSRTLSQNVYESTKTIKRGNSIKNLFLGEKAGKVLTMLYNKKLSLNNSPMITKKSFRAKEKIFQKDDRADKLYYTIEGLVSITDLGKKSKYSVIIQDNLFFGESSLPPFNNKRLASAVALQDSVLFAIDPIQFLRFALTGSNRTGEISPIEILYSIVAQNLGRLKYVEKVVH